MAVPLSAADYYDFFPTTTHNPGDVWVGLPTFGVLPRSHLPGLVVTPACDLSNRKVESITYVPIVPVNVFVVSRSMMPEIKRAVEGQLAAAGQGDLIMLPEGFESPSPADLASGDQLISEFLQQPNLPAKVITALSRAQCGLRVLRGICVASGETSRMEDLRELVGDKAFSDTVKRLITNGRTDVHFLPADEQRPAWSAIPAHSVALFRFPLTLPIEVLDVAQRLSEPDWVHATSRMGGVFPCVRAIPLRPMKRLRLLPRFGSDLVTRYTGMFGRLGSPDFTAETISRFIDEIREGEK